MTRHMHSRKDAQIPPTRSFSVMEPLRDYCTPMQRRLQSYFERGCQENEMDAGAREHLAHCTVCSDFFNMLRDPEHRQ